jgi:hypothetical protein
LPERAREGVLFDSLKEGAVEGQGRGGRAVRAQFQRMRYRPESARKLKRMQIDIERAEKGRVGREDRREERQEKKEKERESQEPAWSAEIREQEA